MKVREVKGPRLAASRVLNSQIDLIGEAVEENEKRTKKFQEPLPVPKLDVKKMVELTKKLTADFFEERRREMGDSWFGLKGEWEWEALRTLRDDLKHYARETGDEDLVRQINEVWPETRPARDLTKEEISRLVELQGRMDELTENLTETIKNALEELWAILMTEAEVVSGTSGARLIFGQAKWYIDFLEKLISLTWQQKIGASTTPPEQVEREMERNRPRRWTK